MTGRAAGVAPVTGAAGGIGRAVVARLLLDGFRVGALDLDEAGLVGPADVTDEAAVAAAVRTLTGSA